MKYMIILIIGLLLTSGCTILNNGSGGRATSLPLTLYMKEAGGGYGNSYNEIAINPGDEFSIDIEAMNLGEEAQYTITFNPEEGIEALDPTEFETNIVSSQEKVFLKSLSFRAPLEQGYYRIRAFASGVYPSAASFWVCVSSNTNTCPSEPPVLMGCVIGESGVDTCPIEYGYTCYDSWRGLGDAEQEGDLRCHKNCETNSDCLYTYKAPDCENVELWKGDSSVIKRFCI
ncbi:MAG: hypothetical protein KKH88_00035 [Nanoarchaeota archaeon]|nr:hypothetical protein [Nanoarchaeota archaeon]